MNYSQAQVEQLWIDNGGNPMLAPTMAAISHAENQSGDPTEINNNPNTMDYSVGLWQVNYFGGLLGPRSAKYGSPSQLAADPNLQARAAIDLAGNGSGLSNWTTYRNGAYRQFLAPGSVDFGGGNSSPGVTPLQTQSAGTGAESCIWHVHVPIPIPGIPDVNACALGTPVARALGGGLLVGAGALLVFVGVAVIVKGSLGPASGALGGVGRIATGASGANRAPRPAPLSNDETEDLDTELGLKREESEARSAGYRSRNAAMRSRRRAGQRSEPSGASPRRRVRGYESEGAF